MNRIRDARASSYHIPRDPFTPGMLEFRRPPGPSAGRARDDSAEDSRTRGGTPGRLRILSARLAFLLLLAAPMAAVAAREKVVAMAPFTAPAFSAIGLPVNVRGLAIEDVSARLGAVGEKNVLVVEGWIVNLRPGQTPAPDLRIALRGADGRDLYVWTTRAPTRRLERAQRVRFAARLEAPPDGARDAIVKFVASGDRPAREAEGS
jgi:hypothetical protein